jgi:hypothetical protein
VRPLVLRDVQCFAHCVAPNGICFAFSSENPNRHARASQACSRCAASARRSTLGQTHHFRVSSLPLAFAVFCAGIRGFGFCAGIRELLACFRRRRCAFAFALASAMR